MGLDFENLYGRNTIGNTGTYQEARKFGLITSRLPTAFKFVVLLHYKLAPHIDSNYLNYALDTFSQRRL
jgi:hypothetical protein